MRVLMTSRANKAAFHGKKARANQRRFCACASVHAPTPWEGEKRKSAASAPVNPLAHSLVAGIQHQQPNQPSRSARFHRLLSSSPRLRNCSNRDSEGETRRSRRRSLSSSSCLFPLLMEGQRRPRFFKVLVGDFARRIVSSPPPSSCCRDPVRSTLSPCLRSCAVRGRQRGSGPCAHKQSCGIWMNIEDGYLPAHAYGFW